MNKTAPYQAFCASRKTAHRFRSLRETENLADGRAKQCGENLINFSGNDYLGLSRHPLLIEHSKEFAQKYGAGAGASRLVTGNLPAYAALEKKLAEGKGQESALILASGYQANVTVLTALADAEILGAPVAILADRLCHNSLLQGALLSGARLTRYHHNDYDHLRQLLEQQRGKDVRCFIVTESVFGMDGDRTDLDTLTQLAAEFDAFLYVDEAHATGIFGPQGFGLTASYKDKIDIAMGTFGKALGSFGAYIACSHVLRDYLIQRCGGLIYSTALPPATLGAINAALELLPQLDDKRTYVQQQAERVRQALRQQGWDCGSSTTQIIPIILGGEEAATVMADKLRGRGILVVAIRPPTVPNGTSRLRLSLSAAHSTKDIDHLINAMASLALHAPKALAL